MISVSLKLKPSQPFLAVGGVRVGGKKRVKLFSRVCDDHFKAINPTKVPQRIMISQDFNHQEKLVERIRRVLRVIAVK